MIPKTLHWCWYGGGEKSASVRRCMNSWRRLGEGWENRLWSEESCDLTVNEYVRGAAQAGRWALVSDYFRLTALERFGGVYFDTDVVCYRPFDDLLPLPGFLGYMYDSLIGTAVMGFPPHHPLVQALLRLYDGARWLDGRSFEITLPSGITKKCNCNNQVFTHLMLEIYPELKLNGRKQALHDLTLFPMEEFEIGRVLGRGHSAHCCEASWKSLSRRQRLFQRLKRAGRYVPVVHMDALLRRMSARRLIRKSAFRARYLRDGGGR